MRRYRGMLVSRPAEGYTRCCEAARDVDARGNIGRIEAPTLVLAAEQDRATPPDDAEQLANVEQPRAFSSALVGHLSA